MGVPKFFRYISERYPCLSEIVRNHQIPDFDNLYLDMNGIIHMCSHPDDGDAHFRISEEQIFKDIFHYIEVLFRMIRPQKLFFMAVDGVAPRAKMNQQRGRRFNSAKLAEKLEAEALSKGEVLPTEARFDSNCITPGTVFMARLHEQLKYFVVNKISTDPLWSKCKIILSGHETPGEGEHKIMDYIRYMRSQPGYDPNTRHCLYGLDADLIMLGLCTHEPHFSLLREEVKFGKKSTKRKSVPEEITFYLLHLSLMRDYLEMEFSMLKDSLSFKFDIESIIDDWVLMGFLVGNDFIPHLPNLHIAKGALPVLYQSYIKTLPSIGGYINEKGQLNLPRFEKFMEALASLDMDNFTEHYADLKYFEAKTGRRPNENERTLYKNQTNNPDDLNAVTFGSEKVVEPSVENLESLALDLDEEPDLEGLPEPELESTSSSEEDDEELMFEEFRLHKKDYYMNKLEYEQVTPEVLRDQAEGYVKAIQWNLYYYYNGCPSWSWYYPHHYAPYISDIKGFSDLKIEFDLGTPFKPYEQLLAVLPSQSKNLLPECYQYLMTEDDSPIKKYYPLDFKKDLNGKRQDWEAVVLVPFIDELQLLDAMNPLNSKLSEEEAERNTHKPMLIYSYTKTPQPKYKSPGYFPDVQPNHAECVPLTREAIVVPVEKLIKGAYPGAHMDTYYPGFPTFKHLKYRSKLEMTKVKVFEQPSRNESMIVRPEPYSLQEDLPRLLLGNSVYVGWPHLTEALVVSISNESERYHNVNGPGEYVIEENKGSLKNKWQMEIEGVYDHYFTRFGIDVGPTSIVAHVKLLVGRKFSCTERGVVLQKQWADVPSCYPIQTVVRNIKVYENFYPIYKGVMDVFPVGSRCFMLGHPHYGAVGEVLESSESLPRGRLKVNMKSTDEPRLLDVKELEREVKMFYMPLFAATSQLSISKNVFSKITGTVYMVPRNPPSDSSKNKINVGLNLKFNMKNMETPGYTRKVDTSWLYSEKTVKVVRQYLDSYPVLFEYLARSEGTDVVKEDIFPEDTEEKVKELKEFLKNLPCAGIERQVSGTSTLDSEMVKRIEEIVDEYLNNQIVVKNVTMCVKPHLLFKSDIVSGDVAPDPQATYQLCDRIVNVREGYSVPVGLKGTVIRIGKVANEEVCTVVFDRPFTGGLALNCSPGRGYRLSKSSMINISHGIRLYQQRTGTKGQLKSTLDAQRQIENGCYPNNLYSNMFPMQATSAFASMGARISGPQHPISVVSNASTKTMSPKSNAKSQTDVGGNWRRSNEATNRPSKERLDRYVQTGINRRKEADAPMQQSQTYVVPQILKRSTSDESNVQRFMEQMQQKVSSPSNNSSSSSSLTGSMGQNILQQHMKSLQVSPSMQSNEKIIHQNQPVNTDALKRLLKINETENTNLSYRDKKVGTSMSAEDFFKKTREQQMKMSPNASIHSCVQLLSLYQSKGLGCPQYQYFTTPNNHFQAQIRLPSGQIILGDASMDKEQASESAAQRALQIMSTSIDRKEQPKKIPRPPDNWYRANPKPPETSQLSSKMMKVPSNPQMKMNTFANPKILSGNSKQNAFVPLQAVRQQVTTKNAMKQKGSSQGQSGDSKTDVSNKIAANDLQEKKIDVSKTEKRRERKMRIAANFNKSVK